MRCSKRHSNISLKIDMQQNYCHGYRSLSVKNNPFQAASALPLSTSMWMSGAHQCRIITQCFILKLINLRSRHRRISLHPQVHQSMVTPSSYIASSLSSSIYGHTIVVYRFISKFINVDFGGGEPTAITPNGCCSKRSLSVSSRHQFNGQKL